jgi:hypothetical protein
MKTDGHKITFDLERITEFDYGFNGDARSPYLSVTLKGGTQINLRGGDAMMAWRIVAEIVEPNQNGGEDENEI